MPDFYVPDLTRLVQPGSLVRNPNIWLKDVDTSCICINLYAAPYPCCSLISPIHVMASAHATFVHGITTTDVFVRFITMDNQIIDRTILYLKQIVDTDIAIGILDQEMPSSIKIVKILPQNWKLYFKGVASNIVPDYVNDPFTVGYYPYRASAMIVNQNKYLSAYDWVGIAERKHASNLFVGGDFDLVYTQFERSINPFNHQLHHAVRDGDQASGMFILVNNELVLVSTVYEDSYAIGTFLPFYRDKINETMLSFGGEYTIGEADLSIGADIPVIETTTSPQIPKQILQIPKPRIRIGT